MKVKELIRELLLCNLEAETAVIAHHKSYKYILSAGGSDGCDKMNCEQISFYVDELCINENQESNRNCDITGTYNQFIRKYSKGCLS